MPEQWLCFIYQYGLGGLFFLFTILVAIRHQTLNFRTYNGKIVLWLIIFGFVFSMSVHALWIYLVMR